MTANLPVRRVPDIGETFTHQGQQYRVGGWLRKAPPPKSSPGRCAWIDEVLWASQQSCGPRSEKLAFCLRDHAEYVEGVGVGGTIVAVEDVVVTGRVDWPEKILRSARSQAIALAGEVVF